MQRNYAIDTLKMLCAVLIVFLHVPTPLRGFYEPIIRCGVPCFFLISGYLLYGEKMQEKTRKSIKRIFTLTVWSSVIYLVYSSLLSRGNLIVLLPTAQSWIDFIFFNENPWAGHLWYLSAYLYVLIIVSGLKSERSHNIAFACIPFLLLTDLALGFYSNALWGKIFPVCYVRNFLCVGLPYFLLGCFLKKKSIINNKSILLLGGVIFLLTSYAEKYCLSKAGLNGIREHYLSTTFLSVCVFLLFIKHKQASETFISYMGKELSLYIYVFHPIIRDVCEVLVNRVCSYDFIAVYSYIAPVVVLAATVLFSHILSKFIKLLNLKIRK